MWGQLERSTFNTRTSKSGGLACLPLLPGTVPVPLSESTHTHSSPLLYSIKSSSRVRAHCHSVHIIALSVLVPASTICQKADITPFYPHWATLNTVSARSVTSAV